MAEYTSAILIRKLIMESTTRGLELSWRDVSFEVPNSRTEMQRLKKEYREKMVEGKVPTHKNVLDRVSGRLAPESFTAIMGASGSGKTTLLNFLSNRRFYLRRVKCSGEVYLNGRSRSELNFNTYVAYVMQDDVLIETMTVREILTFTAKMRLNPETGMQKMMEVVEQLELTKILDSRVGGVLARGISGGERKRVAIAMEILTDPYVLFLDEPTTGLDSYNAENVISVCKKLSETGKTVCCTIHQPNSFIFSLFQNIILLADHKIVFNGPHEQIVPYFSDKGFPCGKYTNPAEHVITVLSNHENAERFPPVQDTGIMEVKSLPEHHAESHRNFCTQLGLLIKRSFQNYVRNKLLLKFMAGSKLLFIFIFLTAFWQNAEGNSGRSVSDRAGFLVFFLVSSSFDAVGSVGGYYDEKGQYVREQANRAYSPLAYYLSKMLSEVPFDVVIIAVYEAIIYAGIGLSFENPEQIFIFILTCVTIFINGKGWCFMLLFAFDSIAISAAVTPFIVVIQFLFAGFFINYNNIPKYLYEFLYTSIFKYTWSAAIINEFDTFDIEACRAESPELSSQCDAVEFYNIELLLWGNIGISIGHTIVVNVLAYFVLAHISKSFRS
jgi:ABC-type multidrug transport system ATPase subunit